MSSHVTAAVTEHTGVDPQHPLTQQFEIVDAQAGIIRPANGAPWRKKFAICGFAQSSRMLAPFEDPEYYILVLNQLYRHTPRADIFVDIHKNFREDNVPGTDHVAYLAQCGAPVLMIDTMPEIPTSIRYPLDTVMQAVVGMDYFTSTVAFEIAWCIYLIDQQVEAEIAAASNGHSGAVDDAGNLTISTHPIMDYGKARAWIKDRYAEREIGLWGIDLIVGTEYDWQKPCAEYLLGLAHARGINVRLPEQTALLKQQWRYGYQTEPVQHPIKFTELVKRGQAIAGEREKLMARLQTLDGALQEVSYWHDIANLRQRGGYVRPNEATSS